ncbi:MAG TPA: prenyltransferase/squalene oxidase repeat-containing protein [Urbifossiella sp.]|nr:prenyltransferase/squalene oxidase repeat-containing protein [Urbifossiella sp.]
MTPRLPLTRRSALRLAATGGAAGLLGWAGHAQDPPRGPEPGADFITPEAQAAIDRGLAFLAAQQLDDGAFTSDRIGGGSAVGIAALAGLALMAGGHQPGRGRYARTVSRAVDYVLACGAGATPGFLASPDAQRGFRGGQNQQAMYSHGFACLFLSEVSGMLPDPARQRQLKAVLEQAVAFTVRAQNKEGGWRYEPQPPQADVSVTVVQMMALRAARNAGLFVRKQVVDSGVEFIKGCQQPDGGFGYTRGQRPYSMFARSAACLVGLFSAGQYSGPAVDRGLRYVMQFLPVRQFSQNEIPPHYYYYGHYYAALAMWTAGGEHWAQWFPAVRDELLGKARAAGGVWTDLNYGPAYATAMSLIVLQLPNNYLPILQK